MRSKAVYEVSQFFAIFTVANIGAAFFFFATHFSGGFVALIPFLLLIAMNGFISVYMLMLYYVKLTVGSPPQ